MKDRQAAVFDLHKDWKVLAGPVLGLSQPTLIGTARVILPGGFDFDALDTALSKLFDDTPSPNRSAIPSERLLLSRAIHWAGILQRRYGISVSERFGVEAATLSDPPALFRIYVPYIVKEAAFTALESVRRAIVDYLANEHQGGANSTAAEKSMERLAAALEPFKASINVSRFLRAADRLGIPVDAVTGNLIQFGIGRRSRLMVGSYIDTTSVVGAQIADNKLATAMVLRRAGLPAPVHAIATNEAEALLTAQRLGYPVVVKPSDSDQGRGVAAGLKDAQAVCSAYAEAAKISSSILVERHFEGADYRLTVFDDQVLQIIHRRPGGVTGDGRLSLAELVEAEATTPESRRRERDFGRRLLTMDAEALELAGEQGLGGDSIVTAGRFVPLRRRANISSGGTPISLPLSGAHPDNLALAVHAAAALRLNLAGVDLIIPDIAQSWLDTGALVCEVNGQPQISQTGSPEIHADILRAILPGCPRPPIVVYLASEVPKAPAVAAFADIKLGQSSTRGLWVNGTPIAGPQPNAFAAAKALFANPAIDAAAIHLTPSDILERGVPFPDCDAAIVAHEAADARLAIAWLQPHVLTRIIVRSRDSEEIAENGDPWAATVKVLKTFLPTA